MNSYFASCEQQDRPELRGRPVGVAPVAAENTCCIAASYEAKASGVRTGTKVSDARLMCPNIEIVEARPGLYRALHVRIVAAAELIAPVHEVLSVDEMVIQPWGNEATLADHLRLGVRVQDAIRYNVGEWMRCSIGLAPNAFLAKVASDMQKPNGLSVICPDDIPHKLYGLKLTDWPGIASGMQRRFEGAGVRTTADMYGLDERAMRQVFGGVNGNRWWHLIRGHPVDLPPVKRWQVGRSSVLSPEFRNRAGAWSVACRLLEMAADRLRAEGYHAQRLLVSVASYDAGSWGDAARFHPCNRTFRLREIMRQLWRDTLERPSQVTVSLQDILRDADVTPDLFDHGQQSRIDGAADLINSRFGCGTMVVATALQSRDYLGHVRIPFGKPSDLR